MRKVHLGKFAVLAVLSAGAVLAQAPSGEAPPPAAPAVAAQPTTEERLAAIKQSLAQSQKNLRSYEWVETTVIAMKGEVKSQKQERCYYGADGTLQKTPMSSSPPPKEQKGLRGKVVASKKEEISDYMKQAVALVKSYLPPDPALIQKSKDAGKMSTEILQPGKLVRLVFRDYRLPGDSLGLSVDLTSNKLVGANVASYIQKASDAVTLDVTMGSLDDGSIYSSKIVLDAKAQNMTVTITNSGYKKNG